MRNSSVGGHALSFFPSFTAMIHVMIVPTGETLIWMSGLTNMRVSLVVDGGNVSAVAGTGVAGSTGDGGYPTEAAMHSPYVFDLHRDVHNHLILTIPELLNNRIRQVNFNELPDGVVSPTSTSTPTSTASSTHQPSPSTTSSLTSSPSASPSGSRSPSPSASPSGSRSPLHSAGLDTSALQSSAADVDDSSLVKVPRVAIVAPAIVLGAALVAAVLAVAHYRREAQRHMRPAAAASPSSGSFESAIDAAMIRISHVSETAPHTPSRALPSSTSSSAMGSPVALLAPQGAANSPVGFRRHPGIVEL
ncbi:MAG: hypothetical protein EOO65_03800 [Methanosarcinales archaeon]|nr:MAG: hypothetical protein EOO65_03800 [Methanosarcinales archaeon]